MKKIVIFICSLMIFYGCTQPGSEQHEKRSSAFQGPSETDPKSGSIIVEKWTPVPGSLKQISVGNAGNVWGVNSNDNIFKWNAAASSWDAIGGSLKCVSAGSDYTVYGVNANNEIFRYMGNDTWKPIPGRLKQISVGNAANIWGVNGTNTIYKWNSIKYNWDEIGGSLKCVSAASDGTVWGVNTGNVIYKYLGNNKWKEMDGRLKQISAGSYNRIWGVNGSNTIYKRTGSTWTEVDGSLKWVSVGNDGTAWGVDIYDNIWRRDIEVITPPPPDPDPDDETPKPYQYERRPGILTGKTVYLSAGHGMMKAGNIWKTLRDTHHGIDYVEDTGTAKFINQELAPKLEGMGANVITVRERDMHPISRTVDHPTVTGKWETINSSEKYTGTYYQTTSIKSDSDSAKAIWYIDTDEAEWTSGGYALYVWYPMDSSQSRDAFYTIKYANGGVTTLTLDQSIHGSSWRYIGTFPVVRGQDMVVILSDRSKTGGRKISAGAVRLGGGKVESLTNFVPLYTPAGDNPPAWWEVYAWFNLQRALIPDQTYYSKISAYAYGGRTDATIRSSWAYWLWLDSPNVEAIYISWHSNGFTESTGDKDCRGTHTYVLGERKNDDCDEFFLQNYIHDEIVNDIRTYYETDWNRWEGYSYVPNDEIYKKPADEGNGESAKGAWSELSVIPFETIPGMLIEIAFHDNLYDVRALADPYFRKIAARAVCNGIIRYFDHKHPLQNLLSGLADVPGDFSTGHPYNTTQCRVQKSLTDPWDVRKEINLDEQIRIGTMHDESGQFADNRFIRQTVTGPAGPDSYVCYPHAGEYITPRYRGDYTVTSMTTRGRIIINHASFKVN